MRMSHEQETILNHWLAKARNVMPTSYAYDISTRTLTIRDAARRIHTYDHEGNIR